MKKILICVQSIDGKIAKGPNDLIDWTSHEDRMFFSRETKKAGVVIMGNNTYKNYRKLGKVLPHRLKIILSRNADKLQNEEGVVEFTKDKPSKIIEKLEKRKFKKVFIAGGQSINSLFLKNKQIDEIWLSIEGVILGKGVSLFDDKKYDFTAKLISSKKLSDSAIVLKYKIIN